MHEPLSIVAGDETWDLYVIDVTRVHADWWVQLAVVGPRCGKVTVRVDAANGRGAAAHEILRLVTGWLKDDERGDHALLEQHEPEARAS